jgi:hypothetical protein
MESAIVLIEEYFDFLADDDSGQQPNFGISLLLMNIKTKLFIYL